MQLEKFFGISDKIRYVAVYQAGKLVSEERADLAQASASESDKYEELIVNPGVLTLVRQRGNIDCGGAKFVIIRYGNFYQLVWPIKDGHISIAFEPTANPLSYSTQIETALATSGMI